MTQTIQLFQERMKRINDVYAKKIPDRVPIISMSETWHMHYAKADMRRAFTEDAESYFKAYEIFYRDFYFDGQHSLGNVCPVNMLNKLGGGTYVMTENGLQIMGSKNEVMQPEDYAVLIEDPVRFVATQILPRKFEIFKKDPDEIYETVTQSLDEYGKFGALNGELVQRVIRELGMPFLSAACCNVTADVILDYLRDFVGTVNDIRRHSQKFLEACDALFEWSLKLNLASYPQPREGVAVMSPLHLATYLKPKDFEKFYLPYLNKMVGAFTQRGYNMLLFMENDWTPYLEMLQSMPDGKIAGIFEHGDLKTIKESVGNKMILIGGMPTNVLNYADKDQCVDHAKKVIDELAPGGNYMFAVDRALLAYSDCNADNLRAVNEAVREYGVY